MLYEDDWKTGLECVHVWVFDMKLNKITQELLDLGYTRENPPDKFREWDDFYGGWQYTIDQEQNMVIETPCGIVGNAFTIAAGSLCYWLGIDWCLENDNALIACPFNKADCAKNNPLIADKKIAGRVQCSVHIALKSFDYDSSIEKIRADNEAKKEKLYQKFCDARNGKVCRTMSRFNSEKGEWSIKYDPMNCLGCTYCTLLDRDMGTERGNVYYDIKTTRLRQNAGLIPDDKVASITKGVRLFDKNRNLELCKIISRCGREEIESKVRMKYSTELHFAKYHNEFFEVEVLNIRAEKRESRDLEQDLRDIAMGIEVSHQSDIDKSAKLQKKQMREKRMEDKIKRIRNKVLSGDVKSLTGSEKRQLDKLLDKEIISTSEVEGWQTEYKNKQQYNQMSLF